MKERHELQTKLEGGGKWYQMIPKRLEKFNNDSSSKEKGRNIYSQLKFLKMLVDIVYPDEGKHLSEVTMY